MLHKRFIHPVCSRVPALETLVPAGRYLLREWLYDALCTAALPLLLSLCKFQRLSLPQRQTSYHTYTMFPSHLLPSWFPLIVFLFFKSCYYLVQLYRVVLNEGRARAAEYIWGSGGTLQSCLSSLPLYSGLELDLRSWRMASIILLGLSLFCLVGFDTGILCI